MAHCQRPKSNVFNYSCHDDTGKFKLQNCIICGIVMYNNNYAPYYAEFYMRIPIIILAIDGPTNFRVIIYRRCSDLSV